MTTALILIFTLAQSPEGQNIRILEPTMYHGDEIDAANGETWLGLFQTDDDWELRPVPIRVKPTYDPIVDLEDEATGKLVSIAGTEQPFLLIHGLDAAEPRSVPTAYHGDTFLPLGEAIALSLGPQSSARTPQPEIWHLAAVGTASDLERNIAITNYTLKLLRNLWSPDNQRQTLAAFNEIDPDGAPRLLWAGDLDNDKKLDLLLDLTDHYNVRKLTLFLSTKAGEGELVGKAAELVSVGC